MKMISLIVAGALSLGTATAWAQDTGGTTGSDAPAANGAGGATSTSAPADPNLAALRKEMYDECREELVKTNAELANCDAQTSAECAEIIREHCPEGTPLPSTQKARTEKRRASEGKGSDGLPKVTVTPPQTSTSTGPGEAQATATTGNITVVVHPPSVNITMAPTAAPTAARATATGDGDGSGSGRLQLDAGLAVLNVFRPSLPDTLGLGGKVTLSGGIAGPVGFQLTAVGAYGWNKWNDRFLFSPSADLTFAVFTFTGESSGALKIFGGMEGAFELRTFGSWSTYSGGRLGARFEIGRFVASAHLGYGANQVVFPTSMGGGASDWGRAWLGGLEAGISLF